MSITTVVLASAYDSDLAAARVTGHHQRVIDGVDCCDAKALPNSPRAEVGEAVRFVWTASLVRRLDALCRCFTAKLGVAGCSGHRGEARAVSRC